MDRLVFGWQDGATPIDPDEAAGLLPRLTTLRELNEFEALNIAEARRWASRSRIMKRRLLEIDSLRRLHRQMFGSTWAWAGQFRITQKSIGVEAYRIGPEIQMLVDDVKAWLEFETFSEEEIAARFHHRLVWIHAFPNGNGRHARLATDLLCESRNWMPFTWGSSDLVSVTEARTIYIDALRNADRGDFEALLRFTRS